jgi:hypothetical protein
MHVFGSMARRQADPLDLDLLILDSTGMSPNRMDHPSARALAHLLAVARQWYGFLDPFVWDGHHLWVRNAEATAYVPARLSYSSVEKDLVPFVHLLPVYECH